MAKFFCFCCFVFLNYFLVSVVEASVVILDDTQTAIDLSSKLEVLRAEKNGLSVQQVSSVSYRDKFKANTTAVTNYNYHKYDFWFRLDIRSHSSAAWYLTLDYLIQGEAEIFILPHESEQKNTSWDNSSTPLFTAIEAQRMPTWKLQLPQQQNFSLYLRLNNPKDNLVLSVKLMQASEFIAYSNSRYVFHSIIMTGLIILAIYNLFLAFSLQDRSYFFLVLFVVLFAILLYRTANISPSLFEVLVNPDRWYHTSVLFLAIAAATYYWHIIHLKTDIWLEKLTKWGAWSSLLVAVFSGFLSIPSFLPFLAVIPLMLIVPSLMIRAMVKGQENALRNFFPMLCLFFSIGIHLPLYVDGFHNYPLVTHDIEHMGTLLAILLLSLNHADRTRQIREQAERVDADSKATHNFLTTMSHELRTPMHIVIGANELLSDTSLDKRQQNYLNSQELAARQMLTLVDDILDAAHLTNSQQTVINSQPFDLNQLLNDLENIFSIQTSQKQLDFIVKAKNIPSTVVDGDEKRLKQILTNLIGNAIKYTDSGKITLKAIGAGNTIFFAVRDTGSGIPAEYHALLFQPFYQADSSHSRHKDGAGLGLAISHKLVQQMGGELKLESKLGQGSCFFFILELPVCNSSATHIKGLCPQVREPSKPSTHTVAEKSQQKVEPIQPQQQTSIPLESRLSVTHISEKAHASFPNNNRRQPLLGLTILLIDDGELNLMIGEQLLSLHGADVVLAQSGAEALQKLANQPVDLVLMDVSMPEIDGYQTTRLLRQRKNLSTLPVIALTAHAIAGERERCIAAGMDDYLSKPFQTEQLLTLIKQHCGVSAVKPTYLPLPT